MQPDFAKAAATYDDAAVLAREIQQRLAGRLDYVRLNPARVADIGCATGDGIRELQRRYPAALPLALDFAYPMLQAVQARASWLQRLGKAAPRCVQANAQMLPLKNASLDFIWSNLMLHWLDEPLPAFGEFARVLAPGGLLTFAMLGPDTLKELRTACSECGLDAPLRKFHDMHDIGDRLIVAGFSDPVMSMEMIHIAYRNAGVFLRDQRQLGVRNALLGSLPWHAWRQVLRAWQKMRQADGLPLSFEIIYGHAWKAEPKQIDDGRAIIHFHSKPA